MKDAANYPPGLLKAVTAYNRLFDPRTAKLKPLGLLTALNAALRAREDLDIYEMSHGYTRSFATDWFGFVVNE